MLKNLKRGIFALAIFTLFALPSYSYAALTESQISAILSLLQSFGAEQSVITSVNASLHGQVTPTGTVTTGACSYVAQITHTLSEGISDSSTGGQVTALQRFLSYDSSIYPERLVTGYFGPATERAIQRWQVQNGVVSSGSPETTGYGVVGSLTRAAFAKKCGIVTPSTSTTQTVSGTSTLTADQIRIISPNTITVSVGGTVTVTYVVGSNIVADDPTIVERTIIKANPSGTVTDVVNSTYIPVSRSVGTYNFEWTPNEPGEYQAKLTINHNNRSYTVRSGVITVVGSTISVSTLLTPTVNLSASPTAVNSGQSTLLSWSSTNANRCYLQYNSIQEDVSVSGTKTVTPTQATSYKIGCTNDPGTGKDGPAAWRTITVPVIQVVESGTIDQNSLPSNSLLLSGSAGGTATVGLSIGNGDKVYGSGTISVENGKWSHVVSTSLSDGTYTFSLYGSNNNLLFTKTITVSSSQSQESIVVGVYEGAYPSGVTHSGGYHPEGIVEVNIIGGHISSVGALVLTSYEPVNWVINNPDNISLPKIIAVGYYKQRVTGVPSGTSIEYHSYIEGDGVYQYAYQNSGSAYNNLVSWLVGRGNPLNQFIGNYNGSSFNVFLGLKG